MRTLNSVFHMGLLTHVGHLPRMGHLTHLGHLTRVGRLGPVALLILLGGVGSLAAQSIPSPYSYIETSHELGVFAGMLETDEGRFDLGPESGPVLGAKYALELSGPLSVEAAAATLVSERKIIDLNRAEGQRLLGRTEVLLTSVDARLKFALPGRRTWNGLSPYIFAGGGFAFDLAPEPTENQELTVREDAFDFGTSFIGLLGAGVRWLPSDGWVVRVDGTFNLWQLDTPQGYLDTSRDLFETPPPESEWVSSLGLSLGIGLRL